MSQISSDVLDRPILLRMRPDVAARERTFAGRREWLLRDSLNLRHYRLRDEEYFLLAALDGRVSWQQLKVRFEQRFVPARLDLARLEAFLTNFHREGLLLADTAGQGELLWERHRRDRNRLWWQGPLQILAIRLPGLDPTPLLDWLQPKTRWLFSRWCLGLCGLLVAAALALVVIHWNTVLARIPDSRVFFSPRNLLWLAVAMSATKLLHELGHALTLRRFGGECHQLGLMLLVFTPCLYCDVSDSWSLAHRWQRAAVAAAGIAVELVVAAGCTFLWWFSQPGLFNSLCLNAMFTCSVGTVLFNGNPLLRYDGYFVLADLLDIPNLWQHSRAEVQRNVVRWCLGIDVSTTALRPERPILLWSFGLASMTYRVIVVFGVWLFVWRWCDEQRLRVLGQIVTVILLGGTLVGPLAWSWQLAGNLSMRRQIRPRRVAITLALLAAMLAGVCSLPFPRSITTPVVFEVRNADRVYVTSAGLLRECVPEGASVRRGDTLAKLENPDAQRELARQVGECARWRTRLAVLESRRGEDPSAAAQIPAVRESLRDALDRQRQLEADLQRLTMTAPRDGRVFEPPVTPPSPGGLGTWSGTPLDERNRGSFLAVGTLVCFVGEPDTWEAVAFIEQGDVEHVLIGQRVRLQTATVSGTVLHGVVNDIAKVDLDVVPRELAYNTALTARPDAHGVLRPTIPAYQARIRLDSHSVPLVNRCRGEAKIRIQPQTLGRRLADFLRQTFTSTRASVPK